MLGSSRGRVIFRAGEQWKNGVLHIEVCTVCWYEGQKRRNGACYGHEVEVEVGMCYVNKGCQHVIDVSLFRSIKQS